MIKQVSVALKMPSAYSNFHTF